MNNRYTVPVAFAVAVHATLLFGFRHSATPPPPPPEKPAQKDFEPPPVIEVIEEYRETDNAPNGSPTSERSTQAEPDAPLVTKAVFEIPIPRAPEHRSDSNVIDAMPPGIPGGELFGPDGPRIISVGSLDNPPNARVQPAPDYPYAAKKEGLHGEVLVEFLVDETGHVLNPMVVRSTDRVFEEPSLRAVSKWRFEPGRREGRVVRFRMAIPVVFRLGDS